MKGEFICVVCPNGCLIDAVFSDEKLPKLITFSGHRCVKGETWIKQEIESPLRTFSTNVLVENGNFIMVSVRTTKPVALIKVSEIITEIKKTVIKAPLCIGDVILVNPAGTDTEIIVTRNIEQVDGGEHATDMV